MIRIRRRARLWHFRALGALLVGAVLLSVVAVGCAGGGNSSRPLPEQTGVSFEIVPGSGFDVTPVIRSHGVAWFASAAAAGPTGVGEYGTTVRVYRWGAASWRLDGVVRTPIVEVGVLAPAWLTGSGAPDFTLSGGNFPNIAIVSRVGGRWHTVPFAYGPRSSGVAISVYEGSGIQGHLVHGVTNGCDCAGGPVTSQWFRFERGLFVPTSPPGPAPQCSSAALNAGRPLAAPAGLLPLDYRQFALPFRGSRFACEDGWALATGSQAGKPALALYEQQGHTWRKAEVGSAKLVGESVDAFAAPSSLLLKLAARIHVVLGRPAPTTGYAPPASRNANHPTPESSPVGITVPPGTIYADDWSRNISDIGGWRNWFVAVLQSKTRAGSRRATVTANVYRWQRSAWAKKGQVRFELATAHPEGQIAYVSLSALTGSKDPDFTLTPFGEPGWTAIISDVGGNWHLVRFRRGHSTTPTVDASLFSDSRLIYSQSESATTAYRYRDGLFEPLQSRPTPHCGPRTFTQLQAGRAHFTKAACGYGWALAIGTRKTRTLAALFSDLDSRGWWHEDTVAPTRIAEFKTDTVIPAWLLKVLARRVLH